jgi:hypothetical protein
LLAVIEERLGVLTVVLTVDGMIGADRAAPTDAAVVAAQWDAIIAGRTETESAPLAAQA